jgi:succinate dehydrogenase / fumarate reductase flavoprotein subunit
LKARAKKVRVDGNREYNPGWHTALDLANLMTVSEAIAMSAIQRKESRGAHFREDFQAKSAEYAKFNHVIRRGTDGGMKLSREPLPPQSEEHMAIIKEMG